MWKTETQLRSPLAHFALYSENLGLTDSRKGPMKGILNRGPTIDPLSHMYLTTHDGHVSQPATHTQTEEKEKKDETAPE